MDIPEFEKRLPTNLSVWHSWVFNFSVFTIKAFDLSAMLNVLKILLNIQ